MENENRKKIVHIYLQNPDWSYSKISKELKLPKSTVGAVIKRYKETSSIVRAKGSGRKSGPTDKKLHAKLVKSFKQNPGLSVRDRAKRFNTSIGMVQRTLKRVGMKAFKVVKTPRRTEKQETNMKSRARKLYDEVMTKFNGCLVMDDETYVKMDFAQLPGRGFYVAIKRLAVSDKFKFQRLEKYSKKVLIWQSICSCGEKSRPFFTTRTLDTELYIKECLNARLLPFIRQHNVPVKFWPDLAPAHYSKKTLLWYQQNQVDVIPKNMNPPNCPEFRPIEQYWAIMKRYLRKKGKEMKSVNSLKAQWKASAAKVPQQLVRKMMAGIKPKVRKFIRTGEIMPK